MRLHVRSLLLVGGVTVALTAAAQVADPVDPVLAEEDRGPEFGDVDPTTDTNGTSEIQPGIMVTPDADGSQEFQSGLVAAAGGDDGPEFPPGLDPIIAVHPLDPRLDQTQPWVFTPEGRVIPQRRARRPPTPVFRAPLTDAFSARRTGENIELTFSEQTALGSALGMRVTRLEVSPVVLELTVGEAFSPDQVSVVAFDPSGELVERAPVRLEIEGPQGFVDMVGLTRENSALTTRAPGIGRIWVTSLVPALEDEPFSVPMILVVREPDSPGVRMSSRIYSNDPPNP